MPTVVKLLALAGLAAPALALNRTLPKSIRDLEGMTAEEMRPMFARGGPARDPSFWNDMSAGLEANANTNAGVEAMAQRMGYEYLATTTVYADTNIASCGRLDTRAVVTGTGYYAVASAQAMQNSFPGGGCCWCGKAGPNTGHYSKVAPMGCMQCAKGRFIRKLPYNAPIGGQSHHLFEKEYNIVVADICPHKGNEAWCPERVGTTNTFNSRNHFDWAHPPPGFDNYYFAFTPAPCSREIASRIHHMSKCHG